MFSTTESSSSDSNMELVDESFGILTTKLNYSSPFLSLGNSSEMIEGLLNLHTIINRYKNYTIQAKSCDPKESQGMDLYSAVTRYKNIHGYIALLVCTFGVIANGLIMVVLRRKEMRSPVNLMLFFLAIADLLIMIEYIPFALHMYVLEHEPEDKYSYSSAVFIFFHVHFTQILHTISIQLTLSMAIWRYAALKLSTRSSTFCTFKRCYQVIGAAYICPLFFCILNYLYFEIVPKTKYLTYGPRPFNEMDGSDEEKLHIFHTVCKFLDMHDCTMKKVDLYIVESSNLVRQYPIIHQIHFWTFSVLIKLVPCVVLTFFMCWMVNTLYRARRHHKMLETNKPSLPLGALRAGTSTTGTESGIESKTSKRSGGKKKHHQHIVHPETSDFTTNTSPRFIRSCPSPINGESSSGFGGSGVVVPLLPPGQEIVTTFSSLSQKKGGGNSEGCTEDPPSTTCAKMIQNNNETHNSRGGRRATKFLISLSTIRRTSAESHSQSNGRTKGIKKTDRTSKMLIAVLFLFLLTEFPQGIMHLLTGWYGPEFLRCNYNPWAEVWDILALINSAINFILYCFMSKQFRTQFQVSFNYANCFKRSHRNKNLTSASISNQKY